MFQAQAVPAVGDFEEVVPGLICERYFDCQRIIYRVMAVSNTMLEAWADHVAATLKTWPEDCPYLALHDLSQAGISLQFASLVGFDLANIGITRRGRAQAHQIIAARHLNARVALNFCISVSGHVNKVLAESQRRLCHKDFPPLVAYKTFYNERAALTWLTRLAFSIDATRPITLQMNQGL